MLAGRHIVIHGDRALECVSVAISAQGVYMTSGFCFGSRGVPETLGSRLVLFPNALISSRCLKLLQVIDEQRPTVTLVTLACVSFHFISSCFFFFLLALLFIFMFPRPPFASTKNEKQKKTLKTFFGMEIMKK